MIRDDKNKEKTYKKFCLSIETDVIKKIEQVKKYQSKTAWINDAILQKLEGK